jgi:GGDEF domain-containing protein
LRQRREGLARDGGAALIDTADQSLYAARRAGRDQVMAAAD